MPSIKPSKRVKELLENRDLPELGKALDWKGAGGNFGVKDLVREQFEELHKLIIICSGYDSERKLITDNEDLRQEFPSVIEDSSLGQLIRDKKVPLTQKFSASTSDAPVAF